MKRPNSPGPLTLHILWCCMMLFFLQENDNQQTFGTNRFQAYIDVENDARENMYRFLYLQLDEYNHSFWNSERRYLPSIFEGFLFIKLTMRMLLSWFEIKVFTKKKASVAILNFAMDLLPLFNAKKRHKLHNCNLATLR